MGSRACSCDFSAEQPRPLPPVVCAPPQCASWLCGNYKQTSWEGGQEDLPLGFSRMSTRSTHTTCTAIRLTLKHRRGKGSSSLPQSFAWRHTSCGSSQQPTAEGELADECPFCILEHRSLWQQVPDVVLHRNKRSAVLCYRQPRSINHAGRHS